MSVISATSENIGMGVTLVTWAAIANGDTGSPVACPASADKTVQVYGTWGSGGTLSIEGSMLAASEFLILEDPIGDAITYTADNLATVLDNPLYIRPNASAGDGDTALTVKLLMRRT